MNNYERLIARLDAFIRKYYTNQLIRGGLVFIISLLLFILLVSVGEYFLYMPVWLRVGLMSFFIIAGMVSLTIWVVMPLVKMNRLGKVISHEQAAAIIGQHFPEVSDKLLNILQLKKHADTQASKDLIEASIDQKASQLSVVPMSSAIDLSKNRRLLPYLLPLVLVGVFMLVAAPNVFKDASERLLQPTKSFERPAPFSFVIKNSGLRAVRNSDFQLKATTRGDVRPSDLYIEVDGQRIPMAVDDSTFDYTFRNVTEETTFRLYGGGFYSKAYKLDVVQKPLLKSFNIKLDYPAYIGKQDEVRNSLGDMTVPEGTKVSWQFSTEFTDLAAIRLGDGDVQNLRSVGNGYSSEHRFLRDTSYTLLLKNNSSNITDSFKYNVTVTPDKYPVIQMEEFRDTVSGNQILLNGFAGDDYSITKVLFKYEVTDKGGKQVAAKSVPLDITKGALTSFQHYFDIQTLKLQPGQKVNYFIEAWDNDGVNGSKATRSEMMVYSMYDAKQIDSALQENAKQINSGLSNSADQTQELQQQYEQMQNTLLQNNSSMDWEQTQKMQSMIQAQQQLQSKIEAVKKRFDEQVQQSKQKEYSDDLKQKQEALQKQMDNLLDKELQEQMQKLQELMKQMQMNKKDGVKKMQELAQQNKLFNMDLERMQELMKKLEAQMRMEDIANKADELAQKQLELKDKTDKGAASTDSLKKEQDALNKSLDSTMNKAMKELDDVNKDLERPQDLDKAKQKAGEASDKMKQSSDQLQKNNKSQSSQSQKSAAEALQEMSQTLSQQASGMNAQQIQIDIKAVRQLLTNLMRLSFEQEQLMNKVKGTPITSQQFIDNKQVQKRLHANSIIIRDSLFALSKRVETLAVTVNKETTELEQNMKYATSLLEDRRISQAMSKQQYVMTHTNNLALMLNELLANLIQMQNMAAQPSSGNCSKPGGMNPKPGMGKQLSDIITKQQDLGNAMQQMQKAMQQRQQGQAGGKSGQSQQQGDSDQDAKGGQDGKSKGKQGAMGENGDAESIARMARQQAALRKKLQELNTLLNSNGMGDLAQELREVQQQMDRMESDMVNKRLTELLLSRQQDILTRLLKAEKAVREQEQDNKRTSKNPDQVSRPIPPELQQKLNDKKSMYEQYKTVPPQLKPYYKNMVEQYFQILGT